MANDSVLLLIDLSAIFWECWFAGASEPVSAAQANTVAKIKRISDGTRWVAVCCDAPRPTFRDKLTEHLPPNERYKNAREKRPPSAWEELRQTKERLQRDGHLLFESPEVEADDVVATACTQATARGMTVQIATADKDLMALVADGVTLVSTKTGEAYDPPAVFAKWGVPPVKMRDLLSLMGDSGDSVKGVDGIGKIKAAQLLMTFDDITGIMKAAIDGDPRITPTIRQNLLSSAAQLDLSVQLVTLKTDVAINFEELFMEREQKSLETRNYGDEPDDATEAEVVAGAPGETEEIDPILNAHLAVATERGQILGPAEPPLAGVVRAKPKPEEEVSLVRLPFEQQLQPTNSGSAWKLAQMVFQSRLYEKFKSPEAILMVILRGREMGLGALTALDNFHLIEGRPSPQAYLIVARAKAHPECEYFMCVESTPSQAVWETKHRRSPKPERLCYTYAEADLAEVTKSTRGPNNWIKTPAEMLRKSCAVKLARFVYPDAALGLYAASEFGYDEDSE